MKKLLVISVIGLGSCLSALASDHYGPFDGTSTDNGSCSKPWATDTFQREFTVHDNHDGTFDVRQEYKHGTFVTTGPVSPGACEPDSKHGKGVRAGVKGKFEGFLEGVVTGGVYNPNGCSVAGCL